jgi:hypothetical protein
VKVRIKKTPLEPELDGIRLDGYRPGHVYEVSATMAAWLMAEGYADPEMRKQTLDSEEQTFAGPDELMDVAADRRRSDTRARFPRSPRVYRRR